MAQRPTRRNHPRPYLILGEDSYLRQSKREEIIAANVPEEARAFGVAEFSLARTPLAELLRSVAMPPLLAPKQVLVVSGVASLSEAELDQLEDCLDALPDFTVLLFVEESLDRRTLAARLLLDKCEVLAAESPGDHEARQAAARFARELGLKLPPEVAEELVFVLGTDQGRLRSELEKLRAFVGREREVTADDLAAVVTAARQFHAFDLADLVAERRRADSLTLLRRLLEAGEEPVGFVGLLAWLYRQLMVARGLPPGTPAWKAAQSFHAPRARIEQLVRLARKFSVAELRESLVALQEADSALKASPPHPQALLETLVMRLTREGKPEAVGKP